MELLDYLRYRWRLLTAVFVLGVIAIVAYGLQTGGDRYVAQARLIIRPPASQLSVYASDLDRYIETETALLYTPEYLAVEVGDTGVSPEVLRDSLTIEQSPGSEVVAFQVSSDDPEQAVELVNSAADGYLTFAANRNAEPAKRRAERVADQVDATLNEIDAANAIIQLRTADYLAANPDQGFPNPGAIAPEASSTLRLASSRLVSLQAQQTEAERIASSSVSRSRLLSAASSASLPPGWGLTTYIAATVGLGLALLTAAGLGLSLTRKLISPARWYDATKDGSLPHAVRSSTATNAQRRQTAARLAEALRTRGPVDRPGQVLFIPDQANTREKASPLLAVLAQKGFEIEESDGSPRADGPGSILVMVDLKGSTVDEAALLTDLPESVQRRMVPVLL